MCNTLNVCLIERSRAAELVPALLDALARAGAPRAPGGAGAAPNFKLHVAARDAACVPADARARVVAVRRAAGACDEPQVVEFADDATLATEWEWEDTPEISLALVDGVAHAAALFNAHSPQFVASLVSDDAAEKDAFYYATNAPFVGDGFTRWVDGQYALKRPELGLANWERGRLFGRGGVLSGDSVFTVRARMT